MSPPPKYAHTHSTYVHTFSHTRAHTYIPSPPTHNRTQIYTHTTAVYVHTQMHDTPTCVTTPTRRRGTGQPQGGGLDGAGSSRGGGAWEVQGRPERPPEAELGHLTHVRPLPRCVWGGCTRNVLAALDPQLWLTGGCQLDSGGIGNICLCLRPAADYLGRKGCALPGSAPCLAHQNPAWTSWTGVGTGASVPSPASPHSTAPAGLGETHVSAVGMENWGACLPVERPGPAFHIPKPSAERTVFPRE